LWQLRRNCFTLGIAMLTSIRLPAFIATATFFAVVTSTLVSAQTVPGTKRDLAFDALMKTIDLDDPQWRLDYKQPTSDGSSIGVFIGKGSEPTDRSFVPTNSSSIPEAEVVSYRLARFLGVSRNYYPVDYYKLGPKAMAQFTKMVTTTKETSEDRIVNRNIVLAEIKANPKTILGIFRLRPKTKIYSANALGKEGKFDLSTGLAQNIRANGKMPDDQKMPLAGIKGGQKGFPETPTEQRVELARQLSTIFVVDMLLGQWDRFWENLEASGDKDGRLKLIARDNGGATLDDFEGHDIYNQWVSRFDRHIINRLTSLNSFLKGQSAEFAGYASPEAWQAAAGFIVPTSFDVFKQKLALLIDKRVPGLVKTYGDKVFFPPKSAEIAALDAADTGESD
jgi:hypothetical protein